MKPHQPGPAPRPEPPMFATAVGEGDRCGLCALADRVTMIKVVLPGGIQVCRACDA